MTETRWFFLLTLFMAVLPIVWILTDPRPRDERWRSNLSLQSLIIHIGQLALLAIQAFLSLHEWRQGYGIPYDTTTIIGLLIFVFGISFAVWAKLTMKLNWGMPATYSKDRQKELVTTGPFRYSRNPIYVGLFAAGLGYFLVLRSILIICLVPVAFYMYVVVRKEEALLQRIFKEKYRTYLMKTPRFLLFL